MPKGPRDRAAGDWLAGCIYQLLDGVCERDAGVHCRHYPVAGDRLAGCIYRLLDGLCERDAASV